MGKIATRKAFGQKLEELGGANKKIVVLDADLSKSTQSQLFAKKYPDRFFEMGIAEANMISTGAGMAFAGLKPFCCSFACFLTGRYDQIRMSVAYPRASVVLVGTHAGIGIGEDGNSQMGLEDINVMRGLPNMMVLQPADELETHQVVEFLAEYNDGPAYLRLTRQGVEDVSPKGYKFAPGKAQVLREGNDIAVFASGGVVMHALQAARELEKNGVCAAVINMASLKPIDEECIITYARRCGKVLTVEDHNVIGGLGTAVGEVLLDNTISCVFQKHGLQDLFGESGAPDALYEKYRLDTPGIEKTIVDFLHGGHD